MSRVGGCLGGAQGLGPGCRWAVPFAPTPQLAPLAHTKRRGSGQTGAQGSFPTVETVLRLCLWGKAGRNRGPL